MIYFYSILHYFDPILFTFVKVNLYPFVKVNFNAFVMSRYSLYYPNSELGLIRNVTRRNSRPFVMSIPGSNLAVAENGTNRTYGNTKKPHPRD